MESGLQSYLFDKPLKPMIWNGQAGQKLKVHEWTVLNGGMWP